jgi:DNA-binding response OmpR family regulator
MVAPSEPLTLSRRRVVLALPDSPFAARAERALRSEGWEVTRTGEGAAAEAAWRLRPAAVVLATDGDGESGWLTCAKLTYARPQSRVVLVGDDTPGARRLARFVKAAALVSERSEAESVIEAVAG